VARNINSNIQTYIQQEGVRIVHLLKLSTSTNITVTNHVKNLVYDSVTYEAGGNFLDIQEVQETGSLEYQNMSVSLQNITTATRDIFKGENFVNKAAQIYVAFLDASENLLDAYLYFDGSISSASLAQTKDTFAVNLELANQWRNWDIVKGRKFTGESQKSVYANDKGLDQAHEVNEDVRWSR